MDVPSGFERWVRTSIEANGVLTLQSESRVRPWSINLCIATSEGDYWGKVNCQGALHEAAVLSILSRSSDLIRPPVAVDVARGWFVTQDGGPTLRQADVDPAAAWMSVIESYSALQLRTALDVDELLAAGVPDLRPSAMPDVFDYLLSTPDAMGVAGLAELRGQGRRVVQCDRCTRAEHPARRHPHGQHLRDWPADLRLG